MKGTLNSLAAVALLASAAFADGGLSGKVTFHGSVPKPEMVNMNIVAYCKSKYPNGMLPFEKVRVGPDNGLKNVFVYVQKGLEGKTFSPPDDAVVLDQKGCWYHPHTFGIMVGQKLEVKNSDDVLHNVNAQPYFNVPTAPGTSKDVVFGKIKLMLHVHCNIHHWMSAYVGIFNNPFYAVTADDGSFSLPNLPPGTYVIAAWHETLGSKLATVTVGPSGTTLNFDFKKE